MSEKKQVVVNLTLYNQVLLPHTFLQLMAGEDSIANLDYNNHARDEDGKNSGIVEAFNFQKKVFEYLNENGSVRFNFTGYNDNGYKIEGELKGGIDDLVKSLDILIKMHNDHQFCYKTAFERLNK